MRSKKKLLIIIIAAVVIAAAIVVFLLITKSGGSDNSVYVQAVSEVNTAQGAYANHYSGVVETQQKEKAEFDTTKKLGEILVSEGDVVKAGDKLFTYDTQSITLDIQQRQLDIELLKTTISDNETQIASLNNEMSGAGSSEKLAFSSQIQQLKAANAQAEYDIKTKEAEIEKLNISLDKAYVAAAIDGTVESVGDIDAIMSGNNLSETGVSDSTLVTVVGNGNFRIKGKISEQNIYELSADMPVIIHSRVDDTTWSGTVTVVESSPSEDDNNNIISESSNERTSFYPFYVSLDSAEGLMLGQHVTIEPDYGQGEAKSGIWLDAGWFIMEGDEAYVWASATGKGKIEKRKVSLGEFDENMYIYEVTDGLLADEFIAWPSDEITQGQSCTTEYVMDETENTEIMYE